MCRWLELMFDFHTVLLRRATRWLTAPLVLPIMLLSRTHILDSVSATSQRRCDSANMFSPQLLPFLPLTLVLNSSLPNNIYAIEPYPLADLQIGFPPNPALTLCLLPWARALYTSLRRHLFQAVLGRRRQSPLASPSSPLLNGNAHGAAPLPAEADFARNQQRHQVGENHLERLEGMLDDPAEPRRIVVTVSSGARLLAGTLVFPWVAASAGSLLFWIAKRQNSGKGLLAKILGVGVASTFTPNQLFGLPSFAQPVREMVDPVWWRNAVGGALLVLLKDTWSITRQVMEIKREQSRRIETQDIRPGMSI